MYCKNLSVYEYLMKSVETNTASRGRKNERKRERERERKKKSFVKINNIFMPGEAWR